MRASLHSIRFFYAMYFAAMGLILPYFPVYLAHLELSTMMIGLMTGLLTIAKLIAPPIAGHWLDKRHIAVHVFVMVAALLAALFIVLAFFVEDSLWWLGFSVFMFGMFFAAILPMTDGISVHLSTTQTIDYGRLRVWGSIGFITASGLGGLLLAPDIIQIFPFLLMVLMLAMVIAARGFPSVEDVPHYDVSESFDMRLKLLFVVAFLMQASHGAYYGFFSLYLLDAGYSGGQIGALWMLGVLAEVVLMWKASHVIQRTSMIWVIQFCLLLAALRWSGLAISSSLGLLIVLQLLHAATFAAFHIVTVIHVKQWAPKQRHAAAQGWYSALGFGLGSTMGIVGCGFIVEKFSFSVAFISCAIVALLGIIPVRLIARRLI